MRTLIAALVILFCIIGLGISVALEVPHKFSPGDKIEAKKFNENFEIIKKEIERLDQKSNSLSETQKMAKENKENFEIIKKEIDKRTNNRLEAPIEQAIPNGTIVAFFSKNGKIPKGWAICNGDQGTPNLSNRFIKGAGSISEAKEDEQGGKKKYTFRVSLPDMELATSNYNHQKVLHAKNPNTGIIIQPSDSDNCITPIIKNRELKVETLDIEPPYYSLVYIMKIKNK